ncbi:MAG: Filamentation induced by cAMP protein Fic [Parcubacteria group bacterium GW2011_GWB1_53_43]|nr:MAG: Filamentation induced by cAMP protein Fic [Parcubacteria group bacterium GW2011_GWB1_53_43]
MALLAGIDGIRGEFKGGLRMTPQAITNLKRSTLITSAGASTRIEGAKLNDEEVEKVMRGLAVSKFADRDSQEVQGYLETLQNVFDSFQTLPLRESVITSLHNQLLKYSNKDDTHRGGYKKKENTVGVVGADGKVVKIMFETTPAYLTGKEMQELVDWTADALEKNHFHRLLIIANFIVEFLKIHPFEDGNGRLSRVISNLLLLRSGYTFVQYVSHEQIIERRSYLQAEKIEDTLSPKQYEVWEYLSSVKEAAPSEIVKATDMALGTVRQALGRLVELGEIKRVGRGRATRYIKV